MPAPTRNTGMPEPGTAEYHKEMRRRKRAGTWQGRGRNMARCTSPNPQAEALVLRQRGHTYREIGQQLGISTSTAKRYAPRTPQYYRQQALSNHTGGLFL